jgi:hypothetical protein
MKLKFIFLALACISILSLCLYLGNINAETLDSEKGFILGVFDLPAQISFDNYVSFFTCFTAALAFIFLPQRFIMLCIGRHEKSPPCVNPLV